MFEHDYPEAGELKACKPDPEQMLQRARKNIEFCKEAEGLLFRLREIPISIKFGQNRNDVHIYALGSIQEQLYNYKKQEQQWLKEIDNRGEM